MSGTLYPILHRLYRNGWLEMEKEDVDPKLVGRPRKTFYRLTEDARRVATRELKARRYRDLVPRGQVGYAG